MTDIVPIAGLLTIEDLCDRLNVSERFIRRLIAERRVTYLKVGAKIRFSEADYDAFLERARADAGPYCQATARG